MKFKSIFSFFILSLIVIISAKILIPALKPSEKKTPAEFFLPQYGQVPNFNLIDASGKKVTGHDLNGIPWIADFIFTRCAFQCPLMTEKMKKISQTLPGIRLVSFSLDPQDTPAVLAHYQASHGARWLFLTGKKGQVQQLSVNGFKLGATENKNSSPPIIHSNKFVLVDATGKIRGYYDGTDRASLNRLISQAKNLIRNPGEY